MAASIVVGRRSDFAKLLKVPLERMPSGCLVSASLRTTQPMVPSPPATMILALGEASFSMSILGSNSTIRLLANALRSLASILGVIEPAFELKISRLVARLGLPLALRVRGAMRPHYFLPKTRLLAGAQGELPINLIQRAQANEWRPSATNPSATTPRRRRPSGWFSRNKNAPPKPWAWLASWWMPA